MPDRLPHASTLESVALYTHHLFPFQKISEANFMLSTEKLGNWPVATRAVNREVRLAIGRFDFQPMPILPGCFPQLYHPPLAILHLLSHSNYMIPEDCITGILALVQLPVTHGKPHYSYIHTEAQAVECSLPSHISPHSSPVTMVSSSRNRKG